MMEEAGCMPPKPLRVGIANDMETSACLLRHVVERDLGWQVAWQAYDGGEAVGLCAKDRPELVLMDLLMPVMDGVEAIREIMSSNPCAILIVMAGVDQYPALAFEALGAGALDVTEMPSMAQESIARFARKMRTVAKLILTN